MTPPILCVLRRDGDASLDRELLGGDVLAVAAPEEGAHVAFPAQLDVLAAGTHQPVGHGFVGDGEIQLVGVQPLRAFAHRLESALYDFAFVGLEYKAFLLKIVEVAGIDSAAIDKEEVEKDEHDKQQVHYG